MAIAPTLNVTIADSLKESARPKMAKRSIQDIAASINQKISKRGASDQPLAFIASERPDLLKTEFIPTNVPELNDALGGGIPTGCITRLAGDAGVGKTSLSLAVGAEIQKKGKWVIYIIGEPPFPWDVSEEVGLDPSKLLILNPLDYGEQLADAVFEYLYDPETRAANDEIGLVIWDSVNTISPKSAVDRVEEKGSEGVGMAERARFLSDFMGKLLGRGMLRAGTAVIMIAQLRTDVMAYGAPTTASGGNALKFECKVLLNLRKKLLPKTKVDDYYVYAGHDIIAEVEKNNVAGKPTTTKYTYIPGVGIDDSLSLFNRGLEEGYITMPERATYLFDVPGFPPVTVKKKADAQEYLKQDKERRDALRTALRTPRTKAAKMIEVTAVVTPEKSEEPTIINETEDND